MMQTSRAAAAEPPTRPAGEPPVALAVAVVHNPAPTAEDAEDEPPSLAADAEVVDTALAVTAALRAAGIAAECVCLDDPDLGRFVARLRARGFNRVFNLVEMVEGDAAREAEFPLALDAAGLPYTGNRPNILRLAYEKDRCRRRLEAFGVPVARGYALHAGDALPADLPFPWFIKPARMDGSIGIDAGSVVYDREAAAARVDWLLSFCGAPCLVEAYLPGPEINVALVPDGRASHGAAGGVGAGGYLGLATAIDFSGYPDHIPPIVTYNCKWVPGTPEYVARSLDARAVLPGPVVDRAIAVARAAFSALEGSGYGRVDLRLDAQGQPRIIDVNPNPDLHPEAGLALAAGFAGIDYPTLVARVVAGASALPLTDLTAAEADGLGLTAPPHRERHARRTRLLHAPHPRRRSAGAGGLAATH